VVTDQVKPMEPLLAEEKIVFGLLASQIKVFSMKEMSVMASSQECRAVAKEVSELISASLLNVSVLSY